MKLTNRFFVYPAVASVLLATGAARSVQPPEHGHEPKQESKHETKPETKPQVVDSSKGKPAEPAAKQGGTKPEPLSIVLPPREPKATIAKDPIASQKADEALTQLKEGNEHWVSGNASHPNATSQRRQEVAEGGQHPFATVFTCADSRLPVERIFDRGVGDIFVVRVAGNVVGNMETGTIEYGVEHLKTPLLVVMGHTKCGAVAAAASKATTHGKITDLVSAIKPAVERAQRNNPRATPEDVARIAVKENVWQSIFDLIKNSEVIREKLEAGQVRVVGAVCDVSTGKIEWLGEHPWQAELVDAMAAKGANTAEVEGK